MNHTLRVEEVTPPMTTHAPSPQATVAEHMTPGPHSIGRDQSLALAKTRMADLHVRHLPVLDGGQIVGMLSERDVALIGSFGEDSLERVSVEQAMTGVPYCVDPGDRVADVAHQMALRKVGSAIVARHGRVLGVFTTTDALMLLSEALGGPSETDGFASRSS